MLVRESPGLAVSISGCSAPERLEPGHLVLAGRRRDVHDGPVSCCCRYRGQGYQRHFLTGVQQVPRLPRRANTLQEEVAQLACRFHGARRHRGPESAQPRAPLGGGRRRGPDAPVIAGPARPAGQPAARPGRPGRRARRRDGRGSSMLRFRAPAMRAARADRRATALAAAAALTCLARTAAGPVDWRWSLNSWPGGQCLNALRPVHEHPPVSGGRRRRGAVINQKGVQLTTSMDTIFWKIIASY